MSSLPASILEKSRISLMIPSRELADDWILLQIIVLFGCQFGFEGQVGQTDDGIHGGADLVAHVGQKIALGLGGGLGLGLLLVQVLHHVEHGRLGFIQFLDLLLEIVLHLLALGDIQKRSHHVVDITGVVADAGAG
jgi:hypothetical protein